MLFNQKFDLIFSIGEDCACSSYLRRYNLQDYSYPFDWLTKATFKTRLDLLLNDFQGFLEKENLIVKEAYVNEGVVMKRMKFGSRGHVDPIKKRTCHITIVVSDNK